MDDKLFYIFITVVVNFLMTCILFLSLFLFKDNITNIVFVFTVIWGIFTVDQALIGILIFKDLEKYRKL